MRFSFFLVKLLKTIMDLFWSGKFWTSSRKKNLRSRRDLTQSNWWVYTGAGLNVPWRSLQKTGRAGDQRNGRAVTIKKWQGSCNTEIEIKIAFHEQSQPLPATSFGTMPGMASMRKRSLDPSSRLLREIRRRDGLFWRRIEEEKA